MSNEMERAFSALSEDAGRVRLAPAEAVRRRGDRQRMTRAVAGSFAVAALVAGVAVGTGVLAGPDRPAPAPPLTSPSASPSPSASAPSTSASVSSSPPPSSGRTTAAVVIPKSIPAKAFLRASDVPGTAMGEPEPRDSPGLPSYCGKSYQNGNRLGVRATRFVFVKSADAPAGSTPEATVYEDIMVFRGSGADAFMEDLRAAVRACPSQGGTKYALRGSLGAGDESMLVDESRPATNDDGTPSASGLRHVYRAVVRVGDAIAFVSNTGYESVSADRDDTVHLGQRAAARLAAWR